MGQRERTTNLSSYLAPLPITHPSLNEKQPRAGLTRGVFWSGCAGFPCTSPHLSRTPLLFQGVNGIQMRSGCSLLLCQTKQRCDATAVAEGCTNFPARAIVSIKHGTKAVSTEGRLGASGLDRLQHTLFWLPSVSFANIPSGVCYGDAWADRLLHPGSSLGGLGGLGVHC